MDAAEKFETRVRLFGAVQAYEDGLFAVSPDRVGFGFSFSPLPWADQQTQDSLNAMLCLGFPTGTVLQVTQYTSPDIEMDLNTFRAMRKDLEPGAIHTAMLERERFLRTLTNVPVGRAMPARLRSIKTVVTVQLPTGGAQVTEQKLAEIRELRQVMRSTLKSAGIIADELSAEIYVRFMETVLNHGPKATWKSTPLGEHDPSTLLCNQLLDGDSALDATPNGLILGAREEKRDGETVRVGDAYVRVMSPKRWPDRVWPGTGFRYVADLMRGSKAMRDPSIVTVNIIYPDADKKRGEIQRSFAWGTQQSEGKLAKLIPDIFKQLESAKVALQALDKGDRILWAYIGAAVIAQTEDRAVQASTDLQSVFREIGFQMVEDRYAVLPLFGQLLPFGASEDMKLFLDRYKTRMSSSVAAILPIHGSWQGTGTPMLTMVARDGQLMSVSPWDTDSNMNILIAASSGSGKSFLANFLIENILSLSGRVWVIDRGYSYKRLCEALGGQYIEFDDSSDLSMNPFSMVESFDDEADVLAGIVEVMAAPREGFDDFAAPEVRRVLKEVWDAKGREMTVDDLSTALKAEADPRLTDIGKQLFSYTSKGEYGKYFNRESTIDMSNRFVVLELQQLSTRPTLQRLVLLQLMYVIQQGMHRASRSQKKLVLIDEAFSLLAGKETASFIEGWYRQLRKFGGSACICTQSVLDLYVSQSARAMVENSAHKYLLAQKEESVEQARTEGKLHLGGDAAFRLLKSVHTAPGEYSEILFNTPRGTGVGRLIVSEFEKLLFSTKAEDVTAIDAERAKGLPLEQAIQRVIENRQGSQGSGLV